MVRDMILPLLLDRPTGKPSARRPAAARDRAGACTLQPGGFEPERGPDGNTIIFDAPDGLVVVDTGRHAWHSDAILAYAESARRPIAAIVNTHWHLDHSSGNGRLKARYPNARVYTTNAIDRVLAPGGFLDAQSGRRARHARGRRDHAGAARRGADLPRDDGAGRSAAP